MIGLQQREAAGQVKSLHDLIAKMGMGERNSKEETE